MRYRIRSLGKRANEITGRFGVERNVVVIGYVSCGVEKFVGEGVEKLRGRRRGTENDEGAVKRNVGISKSRVGSRLRDKNTGIFKRTRVTGESLKMSADSINLRRRNVVEYLHRPIVGMEVNLLRAHRLCGV